MKRMSKIIAMPLSIAMSAVLVALPLTATASAQQMGPDEAEQLMAQVQESMRQLEQMLAKASLKPDDLQTIIDQLRDAVRDNQTDQLPRSLREFLLNNPDLLAKLKDPTAQGQDLRDIEDDIRRMLATDNDGLEKMLRQNPEMLKRLLEEQNELQRALEQHSEVENNLRRLFEQTEQQMHSTEDDIKKLIELAEQMQQQMNQSPSQQPQDQLQQDQQNQQEQQQNQNDQVNDPNQQQQMPTTPPQGQDGQRRPGERDPNAWDMPLPATEIGPAAAGARGAQPPGYEREAAEYFRALARAAQEERERLARQGQGQQQPPPSGTDGSGNSGNNSGN